MSGHPTLTAKFIETEVIRDFIPYIVLLDNKNLTKIASKYKIWCIFIIIFITKKRALRPVFLFSMLFYPSGNFFGYIVTAKQCHVFRQNHLIIHFSGFRNNSRFYFIINLGKFAIVFIIHCKLLCV